MFFSSLLQVVSDVSAFAEAKCRAAGEAGMEAMKSSEVVVLPGVQQSLKTG